MLQLIQALKAAGEPTRLRILLTLDRSELTVSELCRILGQSQPRVSRHLKLLCEAGLLVRQAEGTSAYYRRARSNFARDFLASIRPLYDPDDPIILHDRERLAQVRAGRAELAARSFEKLTAEAELIGPRSVPAAEVERRMLELVGDAPIKRLLDIGTGTGRILELFAPQTDSGVGIELSREMLNLARTTLETKHLDHCSVRLGNAYDLQAGIEEMSLVVLHHVLHFLDEPATAIDEAARTAGADGRLLIVDFAPHRVAELRRNHGHRRLGFADDEVSEWCEAAGLELVEVAHLAPQPGNSTSNDNTSNETPARGDTDWLTVTIWLAARQAQSPFVYDLEVA